MIRLVNNLLPEYNHFQRLKLHFESNDEVIIASPFLMENIEFFFNQIDFSKLKKIVFLTTLKPFDFDQFKKVRSLVSIIDTFSNLELEIRIDNLLHGKIYLFKTNDIYTVGILSSANFTESGLRLSHEWGVEFTEKKKLRELEKQLNIASHSKLEINDILDFMYEIEEFNKANGKTEKQKISLSLHKKLTPNANRKTKQTIIKKEIILTDSKTNNPANTTNNRNLDTLKDIFKNKKGRDAIFYNGYKLLKNYYELNGDCHVDLHGFEGKIMKQGWSKKLKNFMRELLYKDELYNNLDEIQLKLLDDIRFNRKRNKRGTTLNEKVEYTINRLKNAIENNKDFDFNDFNKIYKSDKEFYTIVTVIRTAKNESRGKLTEHHIKELEEVNFIWGLKTGTSFEKVLEYRRRFGTFEVDYNFDKNLYFWTKKRGRIKKFIAKSDISKEWIEELRILGFRVDE